MAVFLFFLQNYWGFCLWAIGLVIILATRGKAEAAQIILSLMLRVEKEAESLLLQNGDEKFTYVVEYGYRILPKSARLLISYEMFENMANRIYVRAKSYLSKSNAIQYEAKTKQEMS